MAKQTINAGGFVDDPSAESINTAFAKVNAMTLELFTELSLGGREVLDLDASPDTIRAAFVKTNTNLAALYTEQSLPSVPVIDVGTGLDDPVPSAETIYAAFTKVNTAMSAVYDSLEEPPSTAADYYVATTGNNSNAGTIGAPFQTVAKGVSMLSAGKTLMVRGGTYVESLINTVPSGTSWSAPVRIVAYPGETVWIRPSSGTQVVLFSQNQRYIEFDGIDLDGANITHDILKIEAWASGNPHHIRIKNAELKGRNSGLTNKAQCVLCTADSSARVGFNEFINLYVHSHGRDSFDHGFYIESPDNLIEHCTIADVPGGGIHNYNGSGAIANRNIYRFNIIRDAKVATDSRGWGIIVYNGNQSQVHDNLIYNMKGTVQESGALYIYSGTGHTAYFNTLVGNTKYGAVLDASGVLFRNNISHGNGTSNFVNNGSNTLSNNLTSTSDPLFVNAGARNYHLQSGSAAVGAGVAVSGITTDLDGVTRGTPPDIGAYEYVP